MSRVHDVLKWANRREVAREVTRRGFRVSGETLNRWVRDEAEFPAIVERIVFDLFTIGGQQETPPPWAEAMRDEVLAAVTAAGLTAAERAALRAIDATARPTGADGDDPPVTGRPAPVHGARRKPRLGR